MRRICLVTVALIAACQGRPLAPESPDGAAADSTPDAATDGRTPSLFHPAPATGCESMHLVVGEGFLYWTDEAGGTVTRAPIAGGPPSPIAGGQDRPTWLAVRGARVFWVTGGRGPDSHGGSTLGRSIRVGSPAGGDVNTIAIGDIEGVVATDDGETVYYSTGAEIQRVSSGGGPSSLVVTSARAMPRYALAISGTTLIALDELDDKVVLIDLTTAAGSECQGSDSTGAWMGPCRWFESSLGDLLTDNVVVRGNFMYWADSDTIRSDDVSATNDVWSNVTMASAPFVNALCLGGDRLFFASDDRPIDSPGPEAPPPSAGLIEMAALDPGSASVVLARGQRRPQSIASDGTRVFWSTGDCAIWSLEP
jgi:hypothetical protein